MWILKKLPLREDIRIKSQRRDKCNMASEEMKISRNEKSYDVKIENNALKKKQSIVEISCKLIRVIYAIQKNGIKYESEKVKEVIGWNERKNKII